MILTCPNCDTKYVVKDGSIPPGGRQVRCASCKHSWHEAGDAAVGLEDDVMTSPAAPTASDEPVDAGSVEGETMPPPPIEEAVGGPPPPDPEQPQDEPVAEIPAQERSEELISDYREPSAEDRGGESLAEAAPAASYQVNEDSDGSFGIPDMNDEEPRSRAWRFILLLLLLAAVIAAAFWFLAPSELKARVGLSSEGSTKLQVMLTNNYRQKLASGNELLAISGRVINPTDVEQAVPPIRASLRNKATKKLVYEWTIAPPAPTLAPGDSRSFNSAEVDIPEGGDELTVTLGAAT
jgi:predicted Zn finger-like uncharacterized protein